MLFRDADNLQLKCRMHLQLSGWKVDACHSQHQRILTVTSEQSKKYILPEPSNFVLTILFYKSTTGTSLFVCFKYHNNNNKSLQKSTFEFWGVNTTQDHILLPCLLVKSSAHTRRTKKKKKTSILRLLEKTPLSDMIHDSESLDCYFFFFLIFHLR